MRTGCHNLISLSVWLSVCVYPFVVFTDCESCTRPISTNPRSMAEECEYGLPSETSVSLHAVSRWSRSPGCCGHISWCVFLVSGGSFFFFFRFFYFERTRPTASTRQPCRMYLSTSNEAVQAKKSLFIMRPFFALRQKSVFIPGCVQGCQLFNSSVCQCV